MIPETIPNYLGKMKFLLQHFITKYQLPNLKVENIEVLFNAINDIIKYQNINFDEFWKRYYNWEQVEIELFEKSEDINAFYQSWNNNFADMNLCANSINQMIYPENYNIAAHFLKQKGFIIDYGCGSATLSLGLYLKNRIKGTLKLLDVQNDISRYINYRIQKYNLSTNVSFNDVLDFNKKNIADGIICIDVIEHLENPSEILIDKISPMLKMGGVLILRAPWRGEITHIDAAPDDFYYNGGRKYLSKYFKSIYRFGQNDISCVYKKIK